jgi:hypothetical protein
MCAEIKNVLSATAVAMRCTGIARLYVNRSFMHSTRI